MTIDLMPVLQALIGLLAVLVPTKLIPWIKSRTTAEQQLTLETAARVAVYAAEQVFGAGKGEDKLSYAIQYLQEKGYKVDLAVLEAAVKELTLDQGK